MRLIDAGRLKRESDGLFCSVLSESDLITLYELIDKQPTIDAVPVVRCDDCWYRYENDNGYYVCGMSDIICGDDDFCSYGKRRVE